MSLIKSFTDFMNQLVLSLIIQTEMSEEELDALCDSIDCYEWYCQNTTQEQDADPEVYAKELIRTHCLPLS